MSGRNLMVIHDDGFQWHVVGYIDKPDEIDLPKWDGWKFMAKMPDGTTRVVSDEVESICGGEIRLKDGTIAREVPRRNK